MFNLYLMLLVKEELKTARNHVGHRGNASRVREARGASLAQARVRHVASYSMNHQASSHAWPKSTHAYSVGKHKPTRCRQTHRTRFFGYAWVSDTIVYTTQLPNLQTSPHKQNAWMLTYKIVHVTRRCRPSRGTADTKQLVFLVNTSSIGQRL